MTLSKMRLQRMIALAGSLSRRAAEKAIKDGAVTVNGLVVTQMGVIVDPLVDNVCVKGVQLVLRPARRYIAYHKPRGLLVTKSDPHGRPTIWEDLIQWKGLNSVGRLDFDSEGLLLLTDDGDFINKMTHPRHEVYKTYVVRVKGTPDGSAIKKLQSGVSLEGQMTLPAKVKRIDHGGDNALLEIEIREGKNRQIRRMCDKIGHPVIRLRRTAVGSVKLGKLPPGKSRMLKPFEIESLLKTSMENSSQNSKLETRNSKFIQNSNAQKQKF